MDKNTTAFFNLIRKSQFDDIERPVPSSVDWNYIYEEAKAQAVLGIIAPLVPEEIVQEDPRWREAIDRQTASYIQYLFAEEELVKLLDSNQIPYVILKGNASAVYYHHPERRQMGDIDILVLPERFQETRTLLINNGYHLDEESESDTRNIALHKNEIKIELHYRYSHDYIDLEKYIIEGMNNSEKKSIGYHSFSVLPRLTTGIVLLDHMIAHIKDGLGLRQIIDWMMYVNQNLNDELWNSDFQKIVREIHMDKFAITVTRMCQIYLGLNSNITWCKTADEELCQKLMTNIMADGNFGRKDYYGYRIEKATSNINKNGLFHALQTSGEAHWNAYQKHHWLKPFAWLYQIFRYISNGLKTKRKIKQIFGDTKRGKNRVELLKELEIS